MSTACPCASRSLDCAHQVAVATGIPGAETGCLAGALGEKLLWDLFSGGSLKEACAFAEITAQKQEMLYFCLASALF